MFRPYFNRILFLSFSEADYNVLCFRVVLICIEFGQKILREMQKVLCKGIFGGKNTGPMFKDFWKKATH